MTSPVHDNTERHRFELVEQGFTVFADYRMRGHVVVVPHVETPEPLRGQGAAGRLMTGVMEMIRARGQTIAPHCPYARAFLERHPEYADLISR